ncbi:crosslink repair DNA glycosylase YcaQ family protein [Saccharibacillus sp. CPCC 101409]|uniref:winged helix-turn-helix domain-containing protein n=1 Tax=Saccharibacillus sp. CPCC 101409 TaxID=3058041 RepID=UPI0026722174|nr:crosslink repair DNA glycosylase YcaQ family protein [Saccharibacillus sp. CPCC 101409]MDO3411806.1 crosslink repair DNA glycosylase YcaQ family protein [Saccharibacillus sp. CPCC 101409]
MEKAAYTLSKQQAGRFLFDYHGLSHAFDSAGKDGILAYVRRVGCIQFDPLNVVGTNPELVLQSRIADFRRGMLWELLYEDRRLVDYWDKNMSIFAIEDWPFFERHRQRHQAWCLANPAAAEAVLDEIGRRGPLCSADLEYDEKVDWAWGPTRLARAALEGSYFAGRLVVHHKKGGRKYYELAQRIVPAELYGRPDPFETDAAYWEWGLMRRIGSVGLLWNRPGDALLMTGLKSAPRLNAFAALLDRGEIAPVAVEGIEHPLYIRSRDIGLLEASLIAQRKADGAEAQAAGEAEDRMRACILAPLDNLLWDRRLILELFGFDYRWEVYKPAAERKYGYYVLPVIAGGRFVARFEPEKQRGTAPLAIKQWWWEGGEGADSAVRASVERALRRFADSLGTTFEGALPV